MLYAAANKKNRLRSLVTLATPIDANYLPNVYRQSTSKNFDIDTLLNEDGNVSGDFIGSSIRGLTPTADLAARMTLYSNFWNDDYVAAHNAMTAWGDDQIPFAREAFRKTARCSSLAMPS